MSVGLALAGGGPLGAIYEIGALCALQESLHGIEFNALDGYVGVSAGSVVAAALANGITPRQMCAAFIENDGADAIDPSSFMRPAWGEYARRAAALPGIVGRASLDAVSGSGSLLGAAERLGRALPAGLFGTRAIEAEVRRLLERPGRTNSFKQLRHHLVIVATDLDGGTAAPFGQPGWDEVPISLAVAASMALPGLFVPVTVNGRSYVDGALKKTLHASVLLERGLDLVLCLNPLVPFEAGAGADASIPRLAESGLPTLLSQTFRALIHSRLELGLKGYERSHPESTIVLFEPAHDDPTLFGANTFGYRERRALAEHAYQRTRADLRLRRADLASRVAPHGISIVDAVLDDPTRKLIDAEASPSTRRRTQSAR